MSNRPWLVDMGPRKNKTVPAYRQVTLTMPPELYDRWKNVDARLRAQKLRFNLSALLAETLRRTLDDLEQEFSA